jgi:hypothetical protein
MSLSANQLVALENLARKQAGEDVDWISISDARALTDLGLAERTREGWIITAAGLELVKTERAERPEGANDKAGGEPPTPFRLI